MPLTTEEEDDVPAFVQDIGTADEGFFLAFLSVCATSLERDAAKYLLPAIALAHTVRTRGSRRHAVVGTLAAWPGGRMEVGKYDSEIYKSSK